VLLAVCCLFLGGVASGCATTQDTAAKKQAESKRFLEAREQKRKQRSKSHDHGSKQR
jgi:hypothetical protein